MVAAARDGVPHGTGANSPRPGATLPSQPDACRITSACSGSPRWAPPALPGEQHFITAIIRLLHRNLLWNGAVRQDTRFAHWAFISYTVKWSSITATTNTLITASGSQRRGVRGHRSCSLCRHRTSPGPQAQGAALMAAHGSPRPMRDAPATTGASAAPPGQEPAAK